ncbi:proline-rich protein 12-like isoform X3 [Eriocheir sinensis]|uniref:proline-rich protein 12-like isoform X3 n=1 Tax=Eriocheir sinensis TaxID=95602 RepID=UPI0021CA4284|nr:proline-rich protein 12-like isoform X3 [Eriocheir sinensis]
MAAALLSRTMRIHLLRLLVPCLAVLVVARGEFTHDRKRMGPLDVVRAEHGCLEEFEVSESTIIRTADSRVLGAEFLNVTDVGNREDCLTLCCATRYCNVAVFEEKRSGSCYLFNCGRPEDLKCQFTGHSYYTSAVLRVNRQKLELGLWSEQSQHEAELTNLSKGLGDMEEAMPGPRARNLSPTTPSQQSPPPPPPPTPSRVTSPTTTTTSTTSTTTTTTTTKPTLPPRKCSRFQFECHSGECIAIYNVCDGIPQCRDNSDEDPKLECPSVSTEGASSVSRRLGEGIDAGGPVQGGGGGGGGGGPWDNGGPARDMSQGMYDGRIFRNRPTILENYGGYQQSGSAGGIGSGGRALEDEGAGYGGRGRGAPSYFDAKTRPAWTGGPYNTGEGGARGGGGGGGGSGGDYLGNPEMRPPFRYPDYGPPRYPAQPQPRLPQQPQQPLQQQYLQPSPHQQQPLQQQQQPPPPPPQPQQQQQQLLASQMNSNPVWMDRPGGYAPQGGLVSAPKDLHEQMQDLHHHHVPLQQQGQEYPQQLAGGAPQQEMTQLGGGLRNTEMGMGGGGNGRGQQGGGGVPRGSSGASSSSLASSPVPPSTQPQGGGQNTTTTNTTTNNNNGGGGSGSGGDGKATDGAGGSGAEGGKKSEVVSSQQHLVKAAHASLARLEVNLEELEVGAREQDAQASGAVLALAMGVCITALLVVLVGCRLREVKRRLRRHRGPRSPYAHDADYLVNGMYL